MPLPCRGQSGYGSADGLAGFIFHQAYRYRADRRVAGLGIERSVVGGLRFDRKAPVAQIEDACLIVFTRAPDRQLQTERQRSAWTGGAIDLHRCVGIAPFVEKPAGGDLASILKGAVS